jgi:hypothetical protein
MEAPWSLDLKPLSSPIESAKAYPDREGFPELRDQSTWSDLVDFAAYRVEEEFVWNISPGGCSDE